jgi:Uma2 family endonuclease
MSVLHQTREATVSAESIEFEDDGELAGPWARVRPLAGGWTAELVDQVPDLPPHTELIDGSLVFVSPQQTFHLLVMDVITTRLRQCVPAGLRVRREQAIALGDQQRPEPDIFVVRLSAADLEQTTFLPAQVGLVIEVESPDSKLRDRRRKPQLYAEAGIAHFWRVENQSGKPVVFVYELSAESGEYKLTGEHRDTLKVEVPFPIEIDLTEIDRL